MKKYLQNYLCIALCLFSFGDVFSQKKFGADTLKCKTNLSMFYERAKVKNYTAAYPEWMWVLENCPKASKNTYKYGLKIADFRYKNATATEKEIESKLIDRVYKMRIENFPDNLGRVYSDWATSSENRGAPKSTVFERLEKAFKIDPARMSFKNLAKYFQEITNRNKDTNTQEVFDTYDDALEAVNKKIDEHTRSKDQLDQKVANGGTLTNKETRKLENDKINLKGLAQVEGVLDRILGEAATCNRLIPFYAQGFEVHKTDVKWLRRAASRLNKKECTDDPIFPKLVEALVNEEPSADAFAFYASILEKRGQKKEALKYIKMAEDREKDPYKKAKLLYQIGVSYSKSSPRASASYAKKALSFRPSMGRAYLLIASAYENSLNSCGTDEFSKRMVYVAAINKARMASKIDPSLTVTANKFLRNYMARMPDTKLVFGSDYKSGDSFKIKCWINETVKVP